MKIGNDKELYGFKWIALRKALAGAFWQKINGLGAMTTAELNRS